MQQEAYETFYLQLSTIFLDIYSILSTESFFEGVKLYQVEEDLLRM